MAYFTYRNTLYEPELLKDCANLSSYSLTWNAPILHPDCDKPFPSHSVEVLDSDRELENILIIQYGSAWELGF